MQGMHGETQTHMQIYEQWLLTYHIQDSARETLSETWEGVVVKTRR